MYSPESKQRFRKLGCRRDWAVNFQCFWENVKNFRSFISRQCVHRFRLDDCYYTEERNRKIISVMRDWRRCLTSKDSFSTVTGLPEGTLQGIRVPILVREPNKRSKTSWFNVIKEFFFPPTTRESQLPFLRYWSISPTKFWCWVNPVFSSRWNWWLSSYWAARD